MTEANTVVEQSTDLQTSALIAPAKFRKKNMHPTIKKIALPLVLSINLILASCGGSTSNSPSGATGGSSITLNGTKYSTSNNAVRLLGAVDQTSQYGFQMGGPAAYISMYESMSGNTLVFQLLSTVDGWPGTYSMLSPGSSQTAYITDKSVATGGNMVAVTSGNAGSITISSFGSVGQLITGSFDINLCDSSTGCSSAAKNYTGTFSVTRAENLGSSSRPANLLIAIPLLRTYTFGIHPATGKNHFVIPISTNGTLTLTVTPTVDVNMAVFTDAAYTTPANCDVTSTLNVTGSGTETCAISVTANQRLYVTVSQPASATARETFSLSYTE